MDLLVSGSDRPPRRPLRAVRTWRPPTTVVGAVALMLVGVLAAAGVAVGPVRARVEERSLDIRVLSSTVSVRGSSTEGVVRARVSNDGSRPVEVRSVRLDVPGVALRPVAVPPARRLDPGAAVEVSVGFAVADCAAVGTTGALRVGVAADGRAPRLLELPVRDNPGDRGLDLSVFAAGCRPTSTPYVVALAVEQVSGQAQTTGATARGDLAVAVRNLAAPVGLVSVTGEVPGVLFVSQTAPGGERKAGSGERVTVPLPFVVPFCDEVPRTGRVLVTVRDLTGALRMLTFPAGEAGVDLTLVFGACRAAG